MTNSPWITVTPATVRKNATELKVGDVVWSDGIRVLLDREPKVYDDRGSTVYSFRGLVLNAGDVVGKVIPLSWLMADDWRGDRWHRSYEGRWTIQGNELATYRVEA